MIKKILFIGLIVSSTLLAKQKQTMVNEDHLMLATMMFYDGKYDKALDELKLVDKTKEEFDKAKYLTLKALLAMKKEKYKDASNFFEQAIKETKIKVYLPPKSEEEKKKKHLLDFIGIHLLKDKPKKVQKQEPFNPQKIRKEKLEQLHLYLSQAYYKQKKWIKTVEALDLAGNRGKDRAALYTLRAECYWKANKKNLAFDALNIGIETFKEDTTLLKQKFYYYADLKLYQAAIKSSRDYLERVEQKPADYISLAQVLYSGGELNEATKILEEAKLKFPTSAKIDMLLGMFYNKKDMSYTTASLFEQASYFDSNYTKDASEMYRRLGSLSHSLYLNTKIKDKREKLKQKIAIYIEQGEFEKVTGLKTALDRYGLLEDDKLCYALAYSYYMVKDYKFAEFYLKKIKDSELFSKATVIRKNIEKCKNNDDDLGCM